MEVVWSAITNAAKFFSIIPLSSSSHQNGFVFIGNDPNSKMDGSSSPSSGASVEVYPRLSNMSTENNC